MNQIERVSREGSDNTTVVVVGVAEDGVVVWRDCTHSSGRTHPSEMFVQV